MYDLIIIGGGASGLAAAITAFGRGKKTLILEKEEKLGKKILVTGNGKCNLSHVDVTEKAYNTPWVKNVIQTDVVGFFHDLGLMTKESDGRVYPYSESALSVVDALRKAYNGKVELGCEVKEITEKNGVFCVNGYEGKNVLLACGSNATFGTASYGLYRKFGHTVTPLRPSIAPLLTDTTYTKGLNGIRAKCTVSLWQNGEKKDEQKGEILFKNNGLSGIASMMLSTYIARNGGEYEVQVDFVPDSDTKELETFTQKSGAACCVQKAVAQAVEKQARDRGIAVAECLKDFRIPGKGVADIKNAQVCCGGLSVTEFDGNLQSKIKKGLYASGEVLDADGICGGYNLHFAFASGIRVGEIC